MQLLNILRNAEPLCGEWYIKAYIDRRKCFDIYTVENRAGHIAGMKVIVLPEGKDASAFFTILEKVMALGRENESILKLYGYGSAKTENNRLVIYVIHEKAEPIEDMLKKTRLNSSIIISIAHDAAEALQACEKMGIYHGDISYGNIYCDRGKYKIGCFGEAELLSNAGISDKENTNYCIAPERRNGSGDIRSDIYSLGIIVYGLYNFGRLPFVPSKDERFILPKAAEETAFEKRMSADNDVFPNPLYAETAVIEFINKCCAFAPENRYDSAEQLIEAAELIRKSINTGRNIEYPNFNAVSTEERQEVRDMYIEDESERETEGRRSPEVRNTAEEEDKNNFTMGAQAVYTETMRRIRDNRHRQVDESVLQDIERTEQRLAKKYGVDSPQYRKF
ncbi:MAG: protein kinase, partial [Candidatus Ornithomonoglobus sp.]